MKQHRAGAPRLSDGWQEAHEPTGSPTMLE